MEDTFSKIVSLCKRRGFVFPSSEIYGGFSSCYDFGPLGVEMKNNIKKLWWNEMTKKHDSIVGLDASILMSPLVWQASGHLTAGFADELVECKSCKKRFKLDDIKNGKCPECKGEIGAPRKFNLMMKTFIGPVEDEASTTYLRAETCQGIYMNFENVMRVMRLKLPFGIAQIGKAFRNEVTPRDFIFRMREFEQMEMQWFCNPKEADKYFEYFKEERLKWYADLGFSKKKLRTREVPADERAHYARKQIDIEYEFPFGFREIEGVHNRGDWDLSNHSKYSRHEMKYEGYYPYIIETSVGVERLLFALLSQAYTEVKGGRTETTESTKEQEIVLNLHKLVSPVKVAVFPLLKNKEELTKMAEETYRLVKPNFVSYYDETGSIGRRYRRADEIGVPYALTIDFDSLKNKDVTVRSRDTMKQERVPLSNIIEYLNKDLYNV